MPGIEVDVPFAPLERAVYVPDAQALVCADVHLGKARGSNVDAPLDDAGDALSRLESLLDRTAPETVVVAGDLLDSFSRIPLEVKRDVDAVTDLVADAGASFVVTPGNHDTLLSSAYDGETAREYRLDDGETVVCHGHERPETETHVERYVIGHDHPALSVEGRKVPCFLYGPNAYEGVDVLVLPAFTRLARGTTVNAMYGRDFQSPLVSDADRFHPAIRDDSSDRTLWFPPLGKCRRLL
ncbi:metallophosphoesterase [Natrialbaceae archaeon GCM10025810]|uniref:metallophosphoesterase n=1 Tax=Halovalidus salilacus TaxID=3075124 RepID=UPI00360B199E